MRVWIAVFLSVCAVTAAFAQGGPPMVTDDPDTPGDGHWEINLASIASKTPGHWNVSVFDADINYGLGDRVQLKLDVPVNAVESDGTWRSGFGDVNVGVKWRFIDAESSGFSMSTYPQFSSSLSHYSNTHGIASADHQLFLPIEFSRQFGEFEVAADLGRNIVEHSPDEWQAGVVVGHACFTERIDCLIELRETSAPHASQTLTNFGIHWKLRDDLVFLAAAGRDVGSNGPDRQTFLCYVGFQLVR